MPPISHGCASNRYKRDYLIYFKIALHFATDFLVVSLSWYFVSFKSQS